MGFFDLNIPYTESTKRNSAADKSTRLKLAVKAMEIGYTGVAFNRTIAGVMSESDRCSISLFPLSSVLKVSPSISSSVNLHRRLLNVSTSAPFRQYTRLTVVVDSPAQGSALNSGNPVLKTYDIVAVRPLKQETFDQACKNYEVDIIAIDFSENRFRLKQPLIKAAIERGVYFEITYSGLIMDAQLRRQMISNAKLLVDWTRGKNLIFSSAAPSVTELRGPYDVANLGTLLGISVERAKAAVSKTCRSLLASALRKKKFYKEAIRVELVSSAEQHSVEGDGFDDWLKWDPISSGEGDLQLDEMAKSFAASNKESKAIDFVSIMDSLPSSHGLHIKDIVSETKGIPESRDRAFVIETIEKGHNCKMSLSTETLADIDGGDDCSVIMVDEVKDSKVRFSCPEAEQQSTQAQVHKAISEANGTIHELENDTGIAYGVKTLPTMGFSAPFDDNHPPILGSEEANGFSLGALNENKGHSTLHQEFPEVEHTRDRDVLEGEDVCERGRDASVAPVDLLPISTSYDDFRSNSADTLAHEPLEDQVMFVDGSETNHLSAHGSSSERVGRKRRSSSGSPSFPFKRVLKPSHLNKARKLKTKSPLA